MIEYSLCALIYLLTYLLARLQRQKRAYLRGTVKRLLVKLRKSNNTRRGRQLIRGIGVLVLVV